MHAYLLFQILTNDNVHKFRQMVISEDVDNYSRNFHEILCKIAVNYIIGAKIDEVHFKISKTARKNHNWQTHFD